VDSAPTDADATRAQWDVFVSHASEDKDVTDPLVAGLTERGLRVWYDRTELRIGDSLRRKIDEGLARCRYGIVLLSHSFFAKDWPQIELDGLAAREIDGRKVILPVWHGLTYGDVVKYSPSLAGRLAAKTADGLKSVIDMILVEVADGAGESVLRPALSALEASDKEIGQEPSQADVSTIAGAGAPAPRSAQDVASGPEGGLDWHVDAETFASTAIEQLRRHDDIPLRLALDQIEVDAGALYSTGFAEELGNLLDRLTCLAAMFVRLRRAEWLDEILNRFEAIYAIPLHPGPVVQDVQSARLWLAIAERIESIGALAVRRRYWDAVQRITLLKTPGHDQYYQYLLRHVVVRSGSMGLLEPKDRKGVSLVTLAWAVAERLQCVRPDVPKSDERILDSICQFDVLAALAAIGDHGEIDTRDFYTSFAYFFSHRTEPIIEQLLENPELRARIFPKPDAELAEALIQLNRLATGEGFRFSGWDGFSSRRILEFIRHHPGGTTR
jgi:TIR domain